MKYIVGATSIYLLIDFIRNRQKISPFSLEINEISTEIDSLYKTAYRCRDFVLLEHSFILRQECMSIQTIADLAVTLAPSEFDNPDIVYDFSGISEVTPKYVHHIQSFIVVSRRSYEIFLLAMIDHKLLVEVKLGQNDSPLLTL